MKILFAGTPWMAADILRALLTTQHEIVGVLTRTDAEVGRKRVLTQSAVAELATQAGISVIKANRIDAEVREQIAALDADFAVIVAYGALLDQAALDLIPKGWTNIHYSLLPDWRGAAPVQQALAAGDRETGVTLFDLDLGMDTGDVYLRVPTTIAPDENAGELLKRLGELAVTALNELLPQIEAGLAKKTPQSQLVTNSGQPARLAKKPTRQDARLEFNQSALANEAKVRAFNPEPMAWAVWQGEPIRILAARALGSTDWSSLESASQSIHAPQAVGAIHLMGGKVLVACAAGTLLELKEVQPAGRKPMTAAEWARGFAPGKKLWLE